MTLRLALGALVLLAGCASTPAAAPVVAAPARAAPARPAAPRAPRFACRYTSTNFYLPRWQLAPAGGAAPWATLNERGVAAELTVPFGDARRGLDVVVTDAKVKLEGHALTEKPFRVYARTPLTLSPVYRTEPGAPLHWVSAKPGELLFDVETPTTWRPRSLMRTAVRCEDTQLTPIYKPWKKKDVPLPDGGVEEVFGEDEPELAQLSPPPGPDGGVQDYRFKWNLEISVTAKVGAEPEGALFFKKEKEGLLKEPGHLARVLELTDTHARVHYTAWPSAIIEGWVPRSALNVVPRDNLSNIFGMLGGLGSRGGGGGGRADRYSRCVNAVTLYARRGSEWVRAGTLQPGAAVEVATRWDDAVDVTLPELRAVTLAEGWRFALKPAEVTACLPGVTPGVMPPGRAPETR